MFSNTLMEPMEFNYSHGQHCTKETAFSGFKRGQCKTKTVECRLQSAKCRPGVKSRFQTADFLSVLCYHVYHWKLTVNKVTRVLFRLTQVKLLFTITT